ncbi:MAG: hypothetical protein IH948_05525 [Bacteroidetes bacterium]|nr:hypothetical protein [Bacteroidota bacterium]
MRNLLVVAITSFCLLACNENRIYSDNETLSPDYEWKKVDTREFEVPVENIDIAYNLSLSFRFATGFQFPNMKVQVTETSPGGEETINVYDLKIMGEKEYLGDVSGDIWDSEHLIVPNKKYEEKGTYKYKLEHVMPQDPLNFAMEIGVILDKISQEK